MLFFSKTARLDACISVGTFFFSSRWSLIIFLLMCTFGSICCVYMHSDSLLMKMCKLKIYFSNIIFLLTLKRIKFQSDEKIAFRSRQIEILIRNYSQIMLKVCTTWNFNRFLACLLTVLAQLLLKFFTTLWCVLSTHSWWMINDKISPSLGKW